MIGETIGNYRVIAKLGQGGMGTVYQAEDTQLGRKVAIKVLNPGLMEQGGRELERFRSEAKVQASLSNPNVVTLFDFVPYGDSFYMVMEFVDGRSLSDLVRTVGALPSHIVVTLSKQILEGLAAAHRLGVVHRDLKPSNIILTPAGIAKVMDFGIAKVQGAKGLTATGALVGTVNYMSPEQVRGEPVDARSDLYSFGVILFELLTGRVPFKDDSDFKIMVHHVQTPPPLPTQLLPEIPGSLEDIVVMCLNKKPEERFQSADAILAALDFFEEQERAAGRGQLYARKTLAQWLAAGGAPAAAGESPSGLPAQPPKTFVDTPPQALPDRTFGPPAAGQSPDSVPMAQSPVAPVGHDKPSSSKKGLVAALVVAIIVVAGAAAGYYFWKNRTASPVEIGQPPIAQATADANLQTAAQAPGSLPQTDASATGSVSTPPGTTAGSQLEAAATQMAANATVPSSRGVAGSSSQLPDARNRLSSFRSAAGAPAKTPAGASETRSDAVSRPPVRTVPAAKPERAAQETKAQAQPEPVVKLPQAFLIFFDLDQGSDRLSLGAAQAQVADIVRQAGYQVLSTGVTSSSVRSAIENGDLESVRARGIGYVILGTADGSVEAQDAYGRTYSVATVNISLELVRMSDGAVAARGSGDSKSRGSANAAAALAEALLNATSSGAREMMRQFKP